MTLIIKDLEISEQLDREAMRAIVGLGFAPTLAAAQSNPLYLDAYAASHDCRGATLVSVPAARLAMVQRSEPSNSRRRSRRIHGVPIA